MREEGAKGQWRELLRVREVDRAWAREGFRRGELSKLETALKSTPVLQLERGEMGGRRSGEARTTVPAGRVSRLRTTARKGCGGLFARSLVKNP
jgi:hypothetical protein